MNWVAHEWAFSEKGKVSAPRLSESMMIMTRHKHTCNRGSNLPLCASYSAAKMHTMDDETMILTMNCRERGSQSSSIINS